jgi:hypothetical protein
MERTLNGIANHVAATQIRAHVRAVGSHDADFSASRAERDELASENSFGKRLRQFARVAKQIPRGRMRGKTAGRRRHYETARLDGIVIVDAAAHKRSRFAAGAVGTLDQRWPDDKHSLWKNHA